MQTLEIIIVGLAVLGALVFLYKTFKPKSDSHSGCGCGTVDCKAPKPKIQKPAENSNER